MNTTIIILVVFAFSRQSSNTIIGVWTRTNTIRQSTQQHSYSGEFWVQNRKLYLYGWTRWLSVGQIPELGPYMIVMQLVILIMDFNNYPETALIFPIIRSSLVIIVSATNILSIEPFSSSILDKKRFCFGLLVSPVSLSELSSKNTSVRPSTTASGSTKHDSVSIIAPVAITTANLTQFETISKLEQDQD